MKCQEIDGDAVGGRSGGSIGEESEQRSDSQRTARERKVFG
jgi:hypothetical protein